MRRFTILTLLAALPLIASCKEEQASTAAKAGPQAQPSAQPVTPKRGVSEEGGMKASGPSQGKAGESR